MFSFICSKQNKVLKHMQYTITDNLKDISDYQFPEVVLQRTKKELDCTNEELEAIQTSLLHYFLVVKDHKEVKMIDKKVDSLWHIFLLNTKAYMQFCSQYVGFYVHHNPFIDDIEIKESEINYIKDLYRGALLHNEKFRENRFNPVMSKTSNSSSSLRNNGSDISGMLIYLLLGDELFSDEAIENDAISHNTNEDVSLSTNSTRDHTNENISSSISDYSESSYSSCSSCSSCSS